MQDVTRTIDLLIDAGPDDVWRALTEAEDIAR